MRKFLLILIILISFLVFPKSIQAQDTGWTIDSFHSDINLQSDGKVKVVETIAVDFNSLTKHGIFREIPYIYSGKNGEFVYTELENVQVSRNETSSEFSVINDGYYKQIKIGDQNVEVSGKNTYQIEYTVSGVIKSFPNYDELYWNAVGDKWPVPVLKSSATFRLPKPEIIQTSCYLGFAGSKETCTSEKVDQLTAQFASTRFLVANEGLTIAIGFTKGIVPILEVEAPKTTLEKLLDPLSLTINAGLFAAILVAGLFFVFQLWFKKGRDFWIKARFPGDPDSKHEPMPIGAHETIVVEYSSPNNLRPAELETLMSQNAKTVNITATLVDLANRGYLLISEKPKKGIFGSEDYELTKKSADQTKLLNYENELLNRLFKSGDIVTLSSLKNKFYKDLPIIQDAIYKEVTSKKFFVEAPNKIRAKYLGLGIGLLVFSFVINFIPINEINFGTTTLFVASLTSPFGIIGLALLLASFFMPQRTALGREMYLRAKGYKLFIDTAEKHRQKFFEKRNLFNEVLPYAIAFGVVEKFAKAFAKMEIQEQQPSWYSGSRTFNAAIFGASMASFSNSFTSTAASAPSSSGSGGGGFSGGGSGGGGGGSW